MKTIKVVWDDYKEKRETAKVCSQEKLCRRTDGTQKRESMHMCALEQE